MQKLNIIDRETATLEFVDGTHDANILQMRVMPYKLYLQTKHWQHFRGETLKFAQYKCQLCNCKDKELNVYHRDYINLGYETFNDVIVLCGDCHKIFHGKN